MEIKVGNFYKLDKKDNKIIYSYICDYKEEKNEYSVLHLYCNDEKKCILLEYIDKFHNFEFIEMNEEDIKIFFNVLGEISHNNYFYDKVNSKIYLCEEFKYRIGDVIKIGKDNFGSIIEIRKDINDIISEIVVKNINKERNKEYDSFTIITDLNIISLASEIEKNTKINIFKRQVDKSFKNKIEIQTKEIIEKFGNKVLKLEKEYRDGIINDSQYNFTICKLIIDITYNVDRHYLINALYDIYNEDEYNKIISIIKSKDKNGLIIESGI